MKATIDLDPELYRAVTVEAARADRSVLEYERDGGVAADEFFRAHAAETRATYGPPGQA
jgi:hypothetical protein